MIIEIVMLFSCFQKNSFVICHVLIGTAAEIMLKRSDWLGQCLTRRCDPSISLFWQPKKAIRVEVDGHAHLILKLLFVNVL